MKRLIIKMKKIEDKILNLKLAKKDIKKQFLRDQDYSKAFYALKDLYSSRSRLNSPIRHVRVCQSTGRARGVFRDFKLCGREIIVRMNKGLLYGLRKSSW